MEKERLSDKWTSDKTNLFCEILADPVNNFMETLESEALKKAFSSELFDYIIAEFKEGLGNAQFKETNQKTLKQERQKPNWWSKSKRFFEKPYNI